MNARQEPTARIEDTVKDFWATRPRRPRRGRKIAGVAAGIANRYRIDPVLVRVGLAVATVYGGAGVLIYLLGWLFLPEQDDEVSPVEALFGKGRSSTSSGFTVLLGVFMVPIAGWFLSGSFTGQFSSWLSLLVVGGLLFLLHQSRGGMTPVTPPAPGSPAPPPPMASAPTAAPTMPYEPPATAEPVRADVPVTEPLPEPPRTTPPSWDPLGAAPFAWDLPEPTPPEPEEPAPPAKRRKPRVAMATLGLSLMTVAGLGLAANAWGDGWITPQHVIGVVLGIIGLGLVFGAFLRAGRGLILLAVPLAVIGMGMTAVSPGGYRGIGDLNAAPTSLTGVQPSYERSVGTISLDLTGLPASGTVYTSAHTDLGTVEILVPANADVTITCEAEVGSVECLGHESAGPESMVEHVEDNGLDGVGGLKIDLVATTNAGSVEVRRG